MPKESGRSKTAWTRCWICTSACENIIAEEHKGQRVKRLHGIEGGVDAYPQEVLGAQTRTQDALVPAHGSWADGCKGSDQSAQGTRGGNLRNAKQTPQSDAPPPPT